jgi:hypothetical protein
MHAPTCVGVALKVLDEAAPDVDHRLQQQLVAQRDGLGPHVAHGNGHCAAAKVSRMGQQNGLGEQ